MSISRSPLGIPSRKVSFSEPYTPVWLAALDVALRGGGGGGGGVGSPERRGLSSSRLVVFLFYPFSFSPSFPSSSSPRNPWIPCRPERTKKKVSPGVGVGARVPVVFSRRTHGCNPSARVP